MMINDKRTDILARINAMLVQEVTTTTRCFNYFKHKSVNESFRESIVTWLQQVQSTLMLSPDTVWIELYLCSGRGSSAKRSRTNPSSSLRRSPHSTPRSRSTSLSCWESTCFSLFVVMRTQRTTSCPWKWTSSPPSIGGYHVTRPLTTLVLCSS